MLRWSFKLAGEFGRKNEEVKVSFGAVGIGVLAISLECGIDSFATDCLVCLRKHLSRLRLCGS